MREFLSILAIIAIMAFAYGVFWVVRWLRAATPQPSTFVRGRQLLPYQQVLARSHHEVESSSDKRSYPWGATHITPKAALGHFVAVGATGAGKTILLRTLLRSVLAQMQSKERCVVFDMKGDYWPFIQQQREQGSNANHPTALLVHPFCESTPAWDIARDATALNADSICAGLLPLDPSDPHPHFTLGARQLMVSVMTAFRTLKSEWTLWDLVVACSSEKNLKEVARASQLPDILDRTAHKGNETGSVVATLSTATHHLRIPAALWHRSWLLKERFALCDWLEDKGPRVLVLGYDRSKKESLQPVLQAMLARIIAELLSGPEHEHGPRTWVMLDELPFAGRIDALTDLLNGGRSKGVAAILGTQSLTMLNTESLYPGTEARALLANGRNRAFLQTSDNETAQWMAEQLGKREAYETGYTEGESYNKESGPSQSSGSDAKIQERFMIHPDEFKAMVVPSERNPLAGLYESNHGVWRCTIPPQHFPERPQGGIPQRASADGLPDSLSWTASDRTRLKFPAGSDKDEPPPPKPPSYIGNVT